MIRTIAIILIFINYWGFSQNNNDTLINDQFPRRSTILSCIVPAGGQIHNNSIRPIELHNRLWWKIPIIYGGLSTAGYFIFSNQIEYSNIKNERLNRLNGSAPDLYTEYLSDSQLKIIQSQHQRWRDLSVVSFLGIYLLQVIDANVEAHLFQFDSSDRLAINFNYGKVITSSINRRPQIRISYLF